jgi:diguanylate cyclase (GGDEF)-like protein
VRNFCYWLLALTLLLPATQLRADALEDGKLVLRGDSHVLQHPISLNGDWNYIAGRWVQPDELGSIMRFEQTRVPSIARQSSTTSPQQHSGTYMLNLLVDTALTHPSALHFQRLCGAATIYLLRAGDTTALPLARLGQLNAPHRGDTLFHPIVTLPPLTPGAYQLLIQQSSFNPSALCGPIEFGDAAVLEYSRTLGTIKNVIVVALLLGVALGSLLLGSQNGDRAAPWLALVCLGCALQLIAINGLIGVLLPPAASAQLYKLRLISCYLALAWQPPALLMLYHHTLAVALPRWVKIINLAIPIALTLALAFNVAIDRLLPYPLALEVLWLIQLLVGYGVVVQAVRAKRDYAYAALAAGLPLLAALPLDGYRYFQLNNIELFTPYAIALLVAMHAGIYTLRFGTAYRLAARLSAHLQEEVDARTRELSNKNSKLEQAQIDLKQANETLQRLSITDGLTGVHNRMYFEQQLEQEWRRCARQALPLSLLMIDADHFKQLNDSAGHQAGDSCLRMLSAEIIGHFKRAGELVARYGGEEFIVLLPDTAQHKALAVAEDLRTAIEHMPLHHADKDYRVTISIGLSTVIPGIDQQPSQLIATADAALYEAKRAGRNRVHSMSLLGGRGPAPQQLHR